MNGMKKINNIQSNTKLTRSSTKKLPSSKKSSLKKSCDENKILPFEKQLWSWYGQKFSKQPKNKSKKTFFSAIIRDDEIIRVNDCAIFLSTGRPNLPFVGRIVSMWQNPNNNMMVKIKWFYHLEETNSKHRPKLIDSKVSLQEKQF